MATVLVTVLVLGVFIPVVQATTGAANEVRGSVIADVYLKTDAKPPDIDRVARLLQAEPPTSSASRSSPRSRPIEPSRQAQPGGLRAARRPTRCRTPSAITPRQPGRHRADPQRARAHGPPAALAPSIDPAIDEVRNREEDTNKILSVTRVVKITMALLAVLLIASPRSC